MILGFNIFRIFILFILIYAKFYTNFSLNKTFYINQHRCFLLWFLNCFCFCQVFKTARIMNHTDFASTPKFLVLIVLFYIKCLQLTRFKVKCYRYFISLEFCELIREKWWISKLHIACIVLYCNSDIFFITSCIFS